MIQIGTKLGGRYEVLEMVGSGGMSYVYKARDNVLNRYVAIKVLRSEYASDQGFLSKFRKEAQSAASLSHPNIVNVFDVGSDQGIQYIVMEYIEGITLKTYIEKKGRLPFREAVSISMQVARGIEDAHNHNIVHRDIKPQNIMITTDGMVKVTDFGIARATTSETISTDVMGSVHYISPEQARNGYVDGKSDIYSLGIVMYEMVTGRVPYDAESPVAVAVKHLQDEMVPPETYAPDLPVSMSGIIRKCTQKNPDCRYASMEELIRDLKHALLHPNEDFVVIPGADDQKTMMMSQKDVDQIRNASANREPEEENGEGDGDGEDGGDDDEDPDEGGFLNPKMEKAVKIMGIVTAIVIVVIVALILGNVFGFTRFGKASGNATKVEQSEDSVNVPDVTGMSYKSAKEALSDKGLEIHATYEQSDSVDEGKIISQDPAAGKSVKSGSTVNVVVSNGNGKDKVTVPDVVGEDINQAESELEDAGIAYDNIKKNYSYSTEYDKYEVMDQDPSGGTEADSSTTVTLTVSRGPQQVTVPNVVGDSQSDATSALKSAKLSVGAISSSYSDTVEEGCVISQSVTAGSSVDTGTTVNLVVSLGKKVSYVTVPSVVGKSFSDAQSTLSNYGLSAVQGSTQSSDSYSSGVVISQDPAAGTSVESGSSITLTISSGSSSSSTNGGGSSQGTGEEGSTDGTQ